MESQQTDDKRMINHTEDRRKFKRFPIQLSTRYLEENKKEWQDCSVINISREGMGIEVYVRERIQMGSILQLEIVVPIKNEPLYVVGTLMWIRELKENPKFNFVGGVKLITIDPEDMWTLLDYAYEDWCKEEKE